MHLAEEDRVCRQQHNSTMCRPTCDKMDLTWLSNAAPRKKLQELLFLKQRWCALSDTIGPVLHQGHMYGTAVIAWRKPYEHRMDCILHPFLHRIRKGGLEVLGVLENCATLAFLVTTSVIKRFFNDVFLLSVFGSPSTWKFFPTSLSQIGQPSCCMGRFFTSSSLQFQDGPPWTVWGQTRARHAAE